MEKCHGELYDVFIKEKHLSENDTRIVVKRLADAVAYLHKSGKFITMGKGSIFWLLFRFNKQIIFRHCSSGYKTGKYTNGNEPRRPK